MPVRKNVPSLRSLCLQYVSSHMDIWCGTDNNTADEDKIVSGDNAVSCLPGVILDDICTTIMRAKKVQRSHLNSVIHRFTTRISFPKKCPALTIEHVIKIIHNVCTNLVILNMSNGRLHPIHMEKLAKSIPLIQSLNLQLTNTTDNVLTNLGKYSPKLRELDVRQTFVRDSGICALCEDDSSKDGDVGGGRCHSIVKLRVEKTCVTDVGAKIALNNFPNLRYFGYYNILRVLNNLYNESNFNGPYKLENIYCYDNGTKYKLHAAACLCPEVTTVVVGRRAVADGDDSWLPHEMTNFMQLTELSISSLSYRDIAKILNVVGSRLKILELLNVGEVDLYHLGEYCSQLSSLRLVGNEYDYVSHGVNMPKYLFRELRELTVVGYFAGYHDTLPPQLETLLIKSSRLQTLNFTFCDLLNDDVLMRVFRCNSFSELRTFIISECDDVHISSIMAVLRISKPLKRIICCNCDRIQTTELVDLEILTRKENLDVTVSYARDRKGRDLINEEIKLLQKHFFLLHYTY